MTKTKKKAAAKPQATKTVAKPKKKLVKSPTKEKVKTQVIYTANIKDKDGVSWTEKKNGNLSTSAGHKEVKGYKSKAAAESAAKRIAQTPGSGAVGWYVSERSTNLSIPKKQWARKKEK